MLILNFTKIILKINQIIKISNLIKFKIKILKKLKNQNKK